MDLFAGLFGAIMTALSVVVAYQFGIKPERDEKRRRAHRALEEVRRRHWEKVRKRSAV
jgi:hypothetical protein